MAFVAPLTLGGAPDSLGGVRPYVTDVGLPRPPVGLPMVAPQAYQPGVGFFEGPNPFEPLETVTGQQNAPGTPSGLSAGPGAPGAPSVPGTVNTGQGFTVGPGGTGLLGDLNAIGANTPAARWTEGMLHPAVANLLTSLAPVTGLGAFNALAGAFGPKGPVSEVGRQGIRDVIGRLETFLSPPDSPPPAPLVDLDLTAALTGPPSTQQPVELEPGENPQGPTSPTAPAGPTPTETGPQVAGENPQGPTSNVSVDDPSVICGELYRQHLMDDATYQADQAFGRRVPPDVRAGYLLWAPTVVRWMRASPVMTWLVARLAVPWAREMAYGDSCLGRVIMRVGWTVCARLGRCGVSAV